MAVKVAVKAAMVVVKAVKVLAVVRVVLSKVEKVKVAAKAARVKKIRISTKTRISTVIRKVAVDRVASRMHLNLHQRLLQNSKVSSPAIVRGFVCLTV